MKHVRLARFLLICCLLLTQLGAFAHAFSHLQHDPGHDHDGQPHVEKICAGCLAFSDTSEALPSQPDLKLPSFEHGALAPLHAHPHTPALAGAYHSRAPPRTTR